MNLFEYSTLLKQLQGNIEKQYSRSLTTIASQIKQAIQYVNKNSKSALKFKSSSVNKQFDTLSEKLQIKFEDIWKTTQEPLKQISNLLSTISPDASSAINEINEIKLKIESIVSSVKVRVSSIRNQYKTIKHKLFILKSLAFVSIKGDLGVIKNSITNIINEANNIVDIDFSVLSKFGGKVAGGNLLFIKQTLNKAIAQYS